MSLKKMFSNPQYHSYKKLFRICSTTRSHLREVLHPHRHIHTEISTSKKVRKELPKLSSFYGTSLLAQIIMTPTGNAGDPGLVPGSGRSPGERNTLNNLSKATHLLSEGSAKPAPSCVLFLTCLPGHFLIQCSVVPSYFIRNV